MEVGKMKRTILLSIAIFVLAGNIVSAELIRDGIDIDFVTIGNPGNPGDDTMGYGAVGYEYQIGKYEVTNAQWDAFTLAAGVPTGNPSSAYDRGAYYTGDQQPTNEVSWYEAAQFCNYLTSGNKISYFIYFKKILSGLYLSRTRWFRKILPIANA